MQRGWTAFWQQWVSGRRSPVRSRRALPRLEPLETRILLTGEFTDLGTAGLSGAKFSSTAWGDYDNDGDLDALVTGLQDGVGGVTKVYQNDGSGAFTDLNAGLTGVYGGMATWGDYDRDGKLDFLVVGKGIAKVYHNGGNGTFTDINASIPGVNIASATWGDYDNDGDLDILLSGRDTNSSDITRIYRNDGNGTFTERNAGLTGLYASSVAWGDYDNDGRLDILVAGSDSTFTPRTKIYHNDGSDVFTDINAGLPGVFTSAVTWGDYDNDGDLDAAIAGNTGTDRIAKIFRNDGHNTFTDIGAGLTGMSYCSLAWGDADNDGDLDLLAAGTGFNGQAFIGPVTHIYRNDNGTFVDSNAGITPMDRGVAAWGDFDGDRDLDILQVGRIGGLSSVRVYRNNASTADTAPAAPAGLTASTASSTSITFSWNAAADSQTPSAGLSYNLRVGTTPGGSDVFTTMADSSNGTHRVATRGPIQGTSFTLKNLSPGATYYWSVQAIDPSLVASNFATEKSLVLGSNANTAPTIGGAVSNQPVNDTSTIAPFATMTITDPDNQNMLAKVTILNGVVRGDFTAATTTGWTRTVIGNDILYSRYYNPAPNIGATVQAAIRALVFKPRANAIKPNTTELTDFTVFINDGVANTSNSTTRVVTSSVNDAPTIGGANPNVAVNDNATVNPLANLTVSDPDNQELLARVTILNGGVRGDFTNAVGNGWTRSTRGNDIVYVRYFSPAPNNAANVQAAFRVLTFQPRSNAISPGTTELTDFLVSVSDGVATPASNPGTRVTTTSLNEAPVLSDAVANQTVNDNTTKAVFSTLTVTDPDMQDMLARITIDNGVNRGDFTPGSSAGWTRSVVGSDIVYARYFSPATNVGTTVQTAIRSLVFQPRANVPTGTTETTLFTVFVNDGQATATDSTTSLHTTGVAPRMAWPKRTTTTIPASDMSTLVLPAPKKHTNGPITSN